MNQKDELILGMTSQGQTKLLKLEDVKDGGEWAMQTQAVQQVPPQQSQGTVDCWERFLHLRSIKVLLVENDDSTRHVVTALLRNCNYEVTEAANGIQAWKILEDLTNHIDLVLTEVVMPCISGIALLSKIMSHKTRKNIPVISKYICFDLCISGPSNKDLKYGTSGMASIKIAFLTVPPNEICVQ
ncbi:hypothetical protein NMG60_11005461 [Bertholletia excelsa]